MDWEEKNSEERGEAADISESGEEAEEGAAPGDEIETAAQREGREGVRRPRKDVRKRRDRRRPGSAN